MIEPEVAAAYGGQNWSPRTCSLAGEIGTVWAQCGIGNEWGRLRTVLLHRPGAELTTSGDPDAVQMLDSIEVERALLQHDALAQRYRAAGVTVLYVDPAGPPPPNLIFVADLFWMTPEGAILARPASTVRAGEERLVAGRLAALGVPLLRAIRGDGVFEGADASWIDSQTVLLASGLRTNRGGADQVSALLEEMGVAVIRVGLPYGAMHLMGTLRLADRNLAFAWPGRVPYDAVAALREHGFEVRFLPAFPGEERRAALNFVTLGPREILMPANAPHSQVFFEQAGVTCHTVLVDELLKAAGGIGCLTGILERER